MIVMKTENYHEHFYEYENNVCELSNIMCGNSHELPNGCDENCDKCFELLNGPWGLRSA